jgi:ABC-type branched-subunit amino acid transport system ATPase component
MTDLRALETRVRQARGVYERRVGAAQQLGEQGMRVQGEVTRLQGELERHSKVSALLTSLGEQAQQQAQQRLEELVTRGLQVVFSENLSFHVLQSVKANQAVTEFVIRSEYDGKMVDTSVMDARGGGMAAVTGFMIRLVVLLLTPHARRVLFLDETFAHVSREYEPRVAEFLKEVSERAGVQIVLVSHSDAYDDAADVRYRLELGSNGISSVA